MPPALSISQGAVVEPLAVTSGDYPLVAIVGPTASGKSALAVRLATAWRGEVINFDSVQVYRGFDVGSGKLPPSDRRGVPHHLMDIVDPGVTFTAGDYRRCAVRTLESVRERGNLPILVGGTGLYLRALLLGLADGPPRSDELRRRLGEVGERRGREFLHRALSRRDPASASRVHPRDTQKIVRALEVSFLAGRPLSHLHRQGRRGLSGFSVLKAGLNPPRAELRRRIDLRTEKMFASGLVEEVRTSIEGSSGAARARSDALGYRQARAVIEGKSTLAEAIADTQTATRQYAKRQLTWFSKEPDVRWFDGFGDDATVERQIFEWLRKAVRLSPGASYFSFPSFQIFGM